MQGTQNIRADLDQAKLDLEIARRASDLSRMSELQYGRIPELESKLEIATESESQPIEHQLLKSRVTESEIADVLSRWTGIPVSKMLEGEKDKLMNMESALHERVVGQSEAVNAVSNAIRRSRAGLADPNKPIGSFLFLGPTGVGKTELCKTLANFLFDTEDAMVRIDMSEFMEKHSVSRLVGAPPGYVGYEEGGYLTDGQGRTVDFKNTVIIMTSNLGSDIIQEQHSENDYEKMKQSVLDVLSTHFRPEFLNRVDETVVFHPLGLAQITSIASKQLQLLRRRLEDKGIGLELTDAALEKLAEAGFDPVYGARPLKRAIQMEIENPLAQKILSGKLMTDSVVSIDADENGLIID